MSAHHDGDDDRAFDERMRAGLARAVDPGPVPAHLLRERPPWVRGGVRAATAALALPLLAAVAVFALRPPELVREAIDHEYYERTLRGDFIDPAVLLRGIGLPETRPVPGLPQLMRPCDIGGRLAYHLTTFFEHGGMVTVFAFERPVAVDDGEGWWGNVYWQVVRGRDGRPLVLISQQKKALAVARASLAQAPAS